MQHYNCVHLHFGTSKIPKTYPTGGDLRRTVILKLITHNERLRSTPVPDMAIYSPYVVRTRCDYRLGGNSPQVDILYYFLDWKNLNAILLANTRGMHRQPAHSSEGEY